MATFFFVELYKKVTDLSCKLSASAAKCSQLETQLKGYDSMFDMRNESDDIRYYEDCLKVFVQCTYTYWN